MLYMAMKTFSRQHRLVEQPALHPHLITCRILMHCLATPLVYSRHRIKILRGISQMWVQSRLFHQPKCLPKVFMAMYSIYANAPLTSVLVSFWNSITCIVLMFFSIFAALFMLLFLVFFLQVFGTWYRFSGLDFKQMMLTNLIRLIGLFSLPWY